MNLKVLRWLLAHKEQLMAVVAIAKEWSRDLSATKQWDIINRIAAIVLPIMDREATSPVALTFDVAWENEGSRDRQLVEAGSEVQALGLDWKLITQVIVPLIVAILRAFFDEETE